VVVAIAALNFLAVVVVVLTQLEQTAGLVLVTVVLVNLIQ
jgi:hypothetical protein